MAPSTDSGWTRSAFALTLISAVFLIAGAHTARAAGVVGTGTAASCTEEALNEALTSAGLVTFNCGPSPVTVTVSSTETITADTTIDGGNLITISGGHSVLVFNVLSAVNTGVAFTVQNLTIADGVGEYGGSGGINNDGGGTLTVTNSTLSGNSGGGIDNYGTLTVTNSTFSGNSTDPGYGGGGIANFASGTLTVTNSTFSGNDSDGGSGIYNAGMLTVTNSTFSSNSAGYGGGSYNDGGTLATTSSTFSNNSAGSGGGIWNSGDLSVTNCTFSRNDASEFFGGDGGGISNSGHLAVTNSTFWGNTARSFVGPLNSGGISNSGTITVVNSILANGTFNCGGAVVTDGGHNIEDGTTCGFSTANGSLRNTDPKLDPAGLADNGGPTQTIALQAGSPAINAGDESVCAAAPVNNLDQRGYVRPGTSATRCSIGAYEYNSPGPGPTPTRTRTPTRTPTRPTPTPTPTAASTFTEVEPNNSCGSPQNLGSPVLPIRIEGFKTQPFGDAVDFYEFSATPGTQLRVTLDGDFSKPTPLTAYGVGFFPSDCPATPSVSAFTTESPARIEFAVAADGISIIGVTACCDLDFSGSGTLEGAYILLVEPLELGTPTPTQTTTPLITVSPSPSATPTLLVCVGDCDGTGSVTVDEIITLVNIALGKAEMSACEVGDANKDGQITVDEILTAVNKALNGCPEP